MVRRFVLQWHLSEACNLKCLHCYQEDHIPVALEFNDLKRIYNQYKELLHSLNMLGHINITGGEPLISPYLYKLLDMLRDDNDLITFSILTNGTLITDDVAKKIKEYNPYYVQVSLEGSKKTNDYIRGKGTYHKIADGIKNLRKYDIFTSISFTATKINYKEFPKVIKFAKKTGVNNVWSDRYIPLGGSIDKELLMNYEETREYLNIMNNERRKLKGKNLTISMNRSLQFQMTNDFAYSCSAGDTLLTVMENGDLVPCRRLPIVVGNLLKDNMLDLYNNSDILINLRKDNIPDDCKSCEHSNTCKGGAKCLTYAIYKDLNHKDIGCNL